MQIDKTIRYESSFPERKEELYISIKQKSQSVSDWISGLQDGFMNWFERIVSNEYSIVRIIIFSTALVCFVFGICGTTQYYYTQVNLFQAMVGLVAVGISYTDIGKRNIRTLGNLFIFFLDIFNIVLVITSEFNDKLSYQFIIYFFVSSLFFNNKRSLLTCIGLNSFLAVAIMGLPSHNTSSLSDFYLAFFGSEFALLLLMLRKFKTESQLAENEQRYRLLAQNSADIICTHSPSGDFEFVSPSIKGLTGYDPSELQNKSAIRFIYPEDRHIYSSKIRSGSLETISEAFQYRFMTKDGGYVWLETVVRGLGDDMGSGDIRFLSQTRSFQRHREYMEQIEKNTSELQNSYKDLEMFAYISSHDMQEPLRMISNYMQLLKRKYEPKLDKDAMEYIDYAVKGASNLQALIKDLLSYSTINKKEITFTPVNMDDLLDDVLSGLQLLMEERNVRVYINEPLLPLTGDKNAVKQLIQNLIQNGIKYNISEIPVIRILCSEDAKNVTYCIQDNGIGIDKQYAQQIFEPFQRLHNKHNFPGTGLGLSICRKIIDRLNGKIWIESEPGIGSSFYFTIPKVQE